MSNPEEARIAGRLSIAYMMAIASEVLRRFPVDMLDLLLITTISNFNLPGGGGTGDLSDPAPARIGVSRNAVSRAINVPLETVRRRVAALIGKKILMERPDGIVFSPDNPIGLGNNADLSQFNLGLLRQLFRELKANGIDLG
ncbi:MAG: hypothetical protein WDN01_19015 [Rhizomicrobium sp.]